MATDHGILLEPSDWDVRFVDVTGSTNTDLLAAVEAGTATGRTALRTDHQTAGRGRLDRRWDAPAGSNLLVSLLFPDPPDEPSTLTHLVALAAVRAVERCASSPLHPRLGLKWPNDLLLDGRKLAGVLAQGSATTGAIVVGLGLNVGWSPDSGASLRRDLGLDTTPDVVLRHVLDEIDSLGSLGSSEMADAYRARLLTLGQRVRVALPADRTVIGVATGVDPRGRLLVAVDGEATPRALDVGDVVHVRPA